MARTTTRFRVYTAAIQSDFELGGAVQINASRVADSQVRAAKILAPKRTGLLERSIKRVPSGAASRYGYTVTVVAYAPYALFVEEGTTTPITPFYGQYLSIPRSRGSLQRIRVQYVRGQRAQHYLSRGGEVGLAQHGYPGTLRNGTLAR